MLEGWVKHCGKWGPLERLNMYESTGDNVGSTIESIAEAGKFLLADPALPRVARTIVKIYKLTPPSKGPIVGETRSALTKAIPALDAYVYTLQHPWSKWVVLAIAIGLPFAIGYTIGRR